MELAGGIESGDGEGQQPGADLRLDLEGGHVEGLAGKNVGAGGAAGSAAHHMVGADPVNSSYDIGDGGSRSRPGAGRADESAIALHRAGEGAAALRGRE